MSSHGKINRSVMQPLERSADRLPLHKVDSKLRDCSSHSVVANASATTLIAERHPEHQSRLSRSITLIHEDSSEELLKNTSSESFADLDAFQNQPQSDGHASDKVSLRFDNLGNTSAGQCCLELDRKGSKTMSSSGAASPVCVPALPSEQCCAYSLEGPGQQIPQKAFASSKVLCSSNHDGPGVALEGGEKIHDVRHDRPQSCSATTPPKGAVAVHQDGTHSCPPPPKVSVAARPFHDRSFSASQSSLRHEDIDVDWLRVHELEGINGNPILFGEIRADNFVQGDLGNCWLLAAMACLTDYPGHIMELFSPREYSSEGRYEVRLYDICKQGWCSVVIDDRIPCNKGTHSPRFCAMNNGGGFWPLLLEKACAKFCGSYAHLDGGSQAWAYQVLTGVVQQKVYEKENRILFGSCWQEYPTSAMMQSLRPDRWRREGMKHTPKTAQSLVGRAVGATPHFSAQSFFKQVAYYEQCGFLISASIEDKRRDRRQENNRPDGLDTDHAYSVLKIQNVHGVRMIKLRNPWGAAEWQGRFARRSHAWKECPDLVKDLCPDLGKEPTGEFWMTWEDFESIFTDVNVSPGCLPVPRQPQRLPEGQGAMPQCGKCGQRGDRRWCMTDLDVDDGEWVRLKSGDFCLACRRSCRGQFRFENDIAGIDTFLAHPQPKLPTPPSEKPLCKRGPGCCDQSPEHFASHSHPWLAAPPPNTCTAEREGPLRANYRRRRTFP